LDSLLVLVNLLHDLEVNLLNPFPNLNMEVLDLFGPLLSLPTKFGGNGEWSEVQRGPWVAPIDNLEGGELCGFAWGPIESKLRMGKELIPPLDIPLHKDPK